MRPYERAKLEQAQLKAERLAEQLRSAGIEPETESQELAAINLKPY